MFQGEVDLGLGTATQIGQAVEADILERETQLEEAHAKLILPETVRDGRLVKQRQAEIAELQSALAQLYEHWEEAAELNS